MVSRFKYLIVLSVVLLGCSTPDANDFSEVEVTSVHPAPGSLSDATVPPYSSPPFNCFVSRIGPATSLWICEIPQNWDPSDPAPKNIGDPGLR